MSSATGVTTDRLEKRASRSTESLSNEKAPPIHDAEMLPPATEEVQEEKPKSKLAVLYEHYRPFILAAYALVILGWWITSIVLEKTRHRWIVQTLFSWSAIAIIAFRFIPNTVITKPVEAVWIPLVEKPWYSLSYKIRLAVGWLCLLAIVFGSAYGFPLQEGTTYADRTINVAGLFLFQFGFWLSSRHRRHVPWPTIIVGLFLQQAIALFVLKSRAGFDIFSWIAQLASDFLAKGEDGAAFFFNRDVIGYHFFFVNTLASIIFFIAFVQMLYYMGVMQWVIEKFAWFFFKIMGVSGAEAVVAAASPWVGQGESACLVRPYVDLMTESELHLTMTSGFSTIAGSVLAAYISMGVPPQNLVTSSVMSIPASMAISKLRLPEMDEPVTRGRVSVDRGESDKKRPANALHAFSQGAIFGLIVAGQILANVLTVVALVAMIDGLMTWVGRGFGINRWTLQLTLGYVFYPITFFLGVPRGEILKVSRLIATKLVVNEFAAYKELQDLQLTADALTLKAHTIATYALCGFANLGSLGIQIGVLGALAPSRSRTIARIALSAMICGFLSTLQTAGIVGMLL